MPSVQSKVLGQLHPRPPFAVRVRCGEAVLLPCLLETIQSKRCATLSPKTETTLPRRLFHAVNSMHQSIIGSENAWAVGVGLGGERIMENIS